MSFTQAKMVFGPGLGGPSQNYRIPSMVVTKSGVLVAGADARFFTGGDNPNRIDKVVRRSLDSGETWGDFILVHEEVGESKENASASIDPLMVYVEKINRIYMIFSHTPAAIGILNSDCTTGEDAQGHKIIKNGRTRYLLKEGRLFTKKGESTNYLVDDKGNVTENGVFLSNINLAKSFKEANTFTLMITHSDDEGLTWSRAESLNSKIKEEYMSFIGAGPGVGLVLKEGRYKGRIIMPIYYGTRRWPLCLSCCVLYSDDDGITWVRGESPNNTRKLGLLKANDRFIIETQMLTESQVIEQEGGVLKYFMRNHDRRRRVAVAYSHDGGATWTDFHWDANLPQPICQIAVLRLYHQDKPYVVMLNPANPKERADGLLRLSEDGGETFPYQRMLKAGPFVYSCLAELPDGMIGALYEPNLECIQIDFAKFTVDWIKGID